MDTLSYSYLRAWSLQGGLALEKAAGELSLYSSGRVSWVLTRDIDSHLLHADRVNPIGALLMGGAKGDIAKEWIDGQVVIAREKRASEMPGATYLVMVASGSIQHPLPAMLRDMGDALVGFDGPNVQEIIGRHKRDVASGLATLVLRYNLAYTEVATSFSFLDNAGRLLYFRGQPMFGDMSVAMVVSQQSNLGTYFTTTFDSLAHYKELGTVLAILGYARSGSDRLRRFIASWSALELLVTSLWENISKTLQEKEVGDAEYARLAKSMTQALGELALKGGFSITSPRSRFFVIARVLADCGQDVDVSTDESVFSAAQNVRHDLVHNFVLDERKLPIDETSSLVVKYVRAYIGCGKF